MATKSQRMSEMDLKPSWEKGIWIPPELALLKDLTKRFSGAPPQISLRPPQMQDMRRLPMYLAPRRHFERELAFIPELNCPLRYVKCRSDGCLEFNKEVTQLYEGRVILEALSPRESDKENSIKLFNSRNGFGGLDREENIPNLRNLLQDSWVFAGSASPAPTLDPIIVKSWTRFTSQSLVRIQFSELIISKGDLNWENGEKLACRQYVAARMIAGASLWIDDRHPILSNFRRLSERPTSYTTSNNEILRNHLQKRRWVWITRTHGGKIVIDIPRTEEFYDARLAFFEHRSDCLLRSFCQRRQWTQKQTDKLATTRSIRGKLEQLMMMSQLAEMEMKADSATAATFGPWLDFLVSSTCNENDQIFRAVRELEVARFFIMGIRFIREINAEGGHDTGLLAIPEFSELIDTSDLRSAAEILSAKSSSKNGKADRCTRQKGNFCSLLALLGCTSPSLSEWQQMRSMLQNIEGFCPQNEAECALILVTRRQERCVLKEKEEQEWKGLPEGGESSLTIQLYTTTNRVEYPPRSQCSWDNCEDRKGFLEREKPRRLEDKELYFSKVNNTGGLDRSEPLSSREGISQDSKKTEEAKRSEEPDQNLEYERILESNRRQEPEKSQKPGRSNPKNKRSLRRELASFLPPFRPSVKLGEPGKLNVSTTHHITANMQTQIPQEVSKRFPTARFNTPIKAPTAGVTSTSAEKGSQPTTVRHTEDTSDPMLSNSLQSQQIMSPVAKIPVQHILQCCSSTKLDELDTPRTKEVASAPITAPAVPRKSEIGQPRTVPNVLSPILEAAEAEHRHRESTASSLTQDSGYKSKNSAESARSEEPLKAKTSILASNLESSKIASETVPIPVDDEDYGY